MEDRFRLRRPAFRHDSGTVQAPVGCLGDELSAVVPASTWLTARWLDEQPVQPFGL
jgi:hypothetical protein